MKQIYLLKLTFRGIVYLYTNANYDFTISAITNLATYPEITLSIGDVFLSKNIEMPNSFVQDSGTEDNPIAIVMDYVEPFTLVSTMDNGVLIEVYEVLNDTYIYPRFSGELTQFSIDKQISLVFSTAKVKFKLSLPVLTMTGGCALRTYSLECGVDKDNFRQLITIVGSVDRTLIINHEDHAAVVARQVVLDADNLGLAYSNGYIEMITLGSIFSVEEQEDTTYPAIVLTSHKIKLYTVDPFLPTQKVTVLSSYQAINTVTVDTTTETTTFTILDFGSFTVTGATEITAYRVKLKDDLSISGLCYIYEGDNRSYDHCNLKFGNKDRFVGFMNPPDRNPVTSQVTQV